MPAAAAIIEAIRGPHVGTDGGGGFEHAAHTFPPNARLTDTRMTLYRPPARRPRVVCPHATAVAHPTLPGARHTRPG